MEESTKKGLIALGAIAAIAGIAAIALYQEDKNAAVSSLIDDANRQLRHTRRELARKADEVSFLPDRSFADKAKDYAAEAVDFAAGQVKRHVK
ncbi:arginyl-tRNA synthetase [Aerococcus agrisoli]|jgi:hypothetical protein|uniref:Arginyl-tRNA synthetase n=1 Tax=Aerococcus agrisoli TaxID=2487350 RepID=A0A3N4G3J4_9LACT|nr:arginyl-tRNA synthetase [Aerococcus agrisoli]RPA55917.1 arginyl-tRNA synthetase [Aerococcus agrisoli]